MDRPCCLQLYRAICQMSKEMIESVDAVTHMCVERCLWINNASKAQKRFHIGVHIGAPMVKDDADTPKVSFDWTGSAVCRFTETFAK